MRISARLFAGLFVLFTSIQTFSQTTYTFDWGSSPSVAWADGNTSGTATNVGGSGVNMNISMAFNGTGVHVAPYPSVNNNNSNAANFQVQNSTDAIRLQVNMADRTSFLAITFTFSSPVRNVSFGIADIDRPGATPPYTYLDQLSVTGTGPSGPVIPYLTKYLYNSPYFTINGNVATGATTGTATNAPSLLQGSPDQDGTAFVNFGNNSVTSITINYGNANITDVQADPANQAMAIGNFSFMRVANVPPAAENITNSSLPQGYPATVISSLVAADKDGSIASYTITTVPTAAQGVLSVSCPPTFSTATCTGGFQDLTPAVLTANGNALVLTPAQALSLRFDPAATFTGTVTFNYLATDNQGAVSNTATYRLPVITQPPAANNIVIGSMPNTNAATAIQTLNASDPDGTVASYTITSVPTAIQGVLSVSCPPTFSTATCTGGFQDLTPAVLAANGTALSLTPAQAATLRFDPAPGFVGTATFNYNAGDNSGNASNSATYTMPVAATATNARPPLANDVTSQSINNSLGNTLMPTLQATDLDGTVASYTVLTIPAPAQGVLRISCPSTPSGLTCSAGFADVLVNTVLTQAEAARLYFDPAATFSGTASFTYRATDNTALTSNTATYRIPVVNNAPVASNLTARVPFNAAATAVPGLAGYDGDGSIASYTITSVPTAAQGVLSVSCPPTFSTATCTGGFQDLTPAVLAANGTALSLTPAQAASLRFDPAATFSGNAPFTYTATDNNGNVSAVATYTLTANSQPPVSNDVTATVMPNTNGATAITALSSTDADGTIASYAILSIPPTTEGVISMPCPATPTGGVCSGGFVNLTAAVLVNYTTGIPVTATQAAGLRFDPLAGFTGVSSFTYNATDNAGFISNTATYTLPVSGAGNIPPVARNVNNATLTNGAAATAISPLAGSDADGTIASYTLTSVPLASQGVISITCPATPTGATCTGGFADLTPAVLTANSGAIVLTPAQAAAMRFDPATGFTGTVNFSFFTTDNSAARSSDAVFSIPVNSTSPVATSVVNASMPATSIPTAISPLAATDPDGTIASYFITSLPPASQGVLSVGCPPTLSGATCTGGFQDLTATVLANYPTTGIPITIGQISTLRFDPAATHVGNVIFDYYATDNSGMLSNSATYTIPVTNLAPISSDVIATKMLNTNGPTAIAGLNSSDADGTISTYVISSIPPTSQGVISIPCPPTPSGATCTGGFADLTAAVMTANPGGVILTPTQAAGLRFDPATGFSGNATFNYYAFDNTGNITNVATYSIPMGTTSTLPLTLITFSAERSGDNIVARWKTEDEQNVSHFVVEYSTDGSHYTTGATASANNQPSNNYQSTLLNYTQPLYYLRLKSTDIDGKVRYSGIVTVTYGNSGKSIAVTPNPANANMQFVINSDVKAMADVRVISATGQVIYRTQQQVFKGTNVMPGHDVLPRLTQGTYMLNVIIDGEMLITKFVY